MLDDHSEEEKDVSKGQEPTYDRPLECSQCQKPASIHYCEIVGKKQQCLGMCRDCPNLQHRLYGAGLGASAHPTLGRGLAGGLTCGNCGTTLEAVQMGQPLGCSECYEVFSSLLLNEVVHAGQAPERLLTKKNTVPAHVGRTPGEGAEINPSVRLVALNEALNETLGREDYEQAAWIRDQIKELTQEEEGESNN